MHISSPFNSLLCLVGLVLAGASPAGAQVVRTKKPDRGVYRPPVVLVDAVDESLLLAPDERSQPHVAASGPSAKLVRGQSRQTLSTQSAPQSVSQPAPRPAVASHPEQPRGGPLFDTSVDDLATGQRATLATTSTAESSQRNSGLQRVNHDDVVLKRPEPQVLQTPHTAWAEPQEVWEGDGNIVYESGGGMFEPQCGCEGGLFGSGCGLGCSSGCDSGCSSGFGLGCNSGCDSMGCGRGGLPNGRICFNRNEWFGSIELLLMFRDGIRLPNLVTTGPSTDAATAGVIGQTGTEFLVGSNENTFDTMTAGGRLTLGTWLDSQRCRSFVGRAWFGGQNTFDYRTTNAQTPVIVRPFLNVTDNQTAAQDNNLIAFPGRSNGEITIGADSTVYGGDLSIRQFWRGGLGATVDVLYGYQYMGFEETLGISTSSVAIAVPNTPVGTVQAVSDNFSANNQFHGGQIGLAMHYEENCWTFNGLVKTGFGSLRRTSNLTGRTTTTVASDVATTNEGFLVQSTNSGKRTSSTFGWVPELDLSLGWHRFPRFDVTAGYHLVVMTDALRVFDTLDPELAVNSATTPTGQQRPALGVDYGTFFVHGIHFGLQYRY